MATLATLSKIIAVVKITLGIMYIPNIIKQHGLCAALLALICNRYALITGVKHEKNSRSLADDFF